MGTWLAQKKLYYTWGPDTLTRRGTFGGDYFSMPRQTQHTQPLSQEGSFDAGRHHHRQCKQRCKTARNVVSVMQCNDADLLLSRDSINVGGGGGGAV